MNIITSKQLTLVLHKMKSHSGDYWNDTADTIAKDAASQALMNEQKILKLDRIGSFKIDFGILWDNIRIDRNIRKFHSFVCNTFNSSTWSLHQFVHDAFIDIFSQNSYHWPATRKFFASIRNFFCLSTSDSTFHSFILKASHNALPTVDNLRIRHGPSSPYDMISCLFCNNQDESLAHLTECQHLSEA